jgi:hypothetical protein
MKLLLVAIAVLFAGVHGISPSPSRGAVPCFYWDDNCTSSYGVDFPGNDLSSSTVNTTAECCKICKETEGCLHWVARKLDQGFQCYLKTVYGFPRYCADCTFSFTKSDACTSHCGTTCNNLSQFGPAVCGTDGHTYKSPCEMRCTGVSKAADGECDSKISLSSSF